MKESNMYLANLSFFLNYDDGTANDEIELELFKVAFQLKESIHYDRIMGAGFQELEQEQSNFSTGINFMSSLIESVYRINLEKNKNPFIVLGHNDITIEEGKVKDGEDYLVNVQYRLLQDIRNVGQIEI